MITTVNTQQIIERGYCLVEEESFLSNSSEYNLEKARFEDDTDEEGWAEGIWITPLEDSHQQGKRFHFLFANHPVAYLGAPRNICGMVGVATSNGPEERATILSSECVSLFEKAGKAAIDYYRSLLPMYEPETAEKM